MTMYDSTYSGAAGWFVASCVSPVDAIERAEEKKQGGTLGLRGRGLTKEYFALSAGVITDHV